MLSHSMLALLVWQSSRAAPLVMLLVGVLAIGSIAVYLPQSTRLRRRWRCILPALRLTALAALAVSLLQPVMTRLPRAGESGAIVLVVDRYPSMAVQDRQRRPAELVALADAMGWLSESSRTRGDEIIQGVRAAQMRLSEVSDAQSELAYALLSGHSATEATQRLATAASEFNTVATALVTRRSSIGPKTQLFATLSNLQEQLTRPRRDLSEEAWATSMRAVLATVAGAAENFQSVSDETLFNSNPTVRALCRELQDLPRLGLAEQAIVRPGAGLLSNLPAKAPIYGFSIGQEVTPLPLSGSGRPVRRLLLNTEAGGKDLAGAVRAALDELSGVPVEAVVLFSDGRRSAGTPVAEMSGRSPAVNVPVYAIAMAPRGNSLDWSLSHLSLPTGVYVGEPFVVRARVHGVGVKPGSSTEVRCDIASIANGSSPTTRSPNNNSTAPLPAFDSARSESTATNVVLGPDLTADAVFELKINEPGSRRITIRLPELAGEITSENNVVERWVKVYPKKLKVTLLASAPLWDYRYLRDALTAQPGVTLRTQVMEDETFSLSPDEILQQDAIVLFDVAVSSLSAVQWKAIRALPTERGGTVVLIAGAEHLPMEYNVDSMADLLPYWTDRAEIGTPPMPVAESKPAWRTWHGEGAVYHLVPPSEAPHRLRLSESDQTDQRVWDSLPPLFRYVSLPPLKPVVRTLLLERETGEPIVTQMPLGAGQILFVGTDETWRWRHKTGRTFQEGIWLQLLHDATEAPYAATAGRASLDLGKAAISPGEAVEVRVKIDGGVGSPSRPVSAELRVLRDGISIRSQTIASTETDPARYSGTLLGLPAGNYIIEARVDDQGVEYPLHVVEQYEKELEDPSGDRAALERIARASGGRVLSLEQMRELPPLLAAASHEPRWMTLALWDSMYLFVFVVACFSAEWALRKRLGLA